MDVAKAVAQSIVPSVGSVNLGFIKWPYNQPAESKQISYKNIGTAPVSLKLTMDVPAFSLSDKRDHRACWR
ncbi:hypothetical protein [Kibdelosporangium philippinense]|uniref:hypothetical protein n=1 Tax=Kibdelosporangium philippinense TaxID=211113 RepID=UPI00361B568E